MTEVGKFIQRLYDRKRRRYSLFRGNSHHLQNYRPEVSVIEKVYLECRTTTETRVIIGNKGIEISPDPRIEIQNRTPRFVNDRFFRCRQVATFPKNTL